jgi:hypothetical protein
MNRGYKFARFAAIVALCLTLGGIAANADSARSQRKPAAKKAQPQLPPLPSGPTGPVPQIPLDTMAPVPPQVSYQDGQLTIVAANSTLGDILRAVRKQTGAEIDVPAATDRVVTHLGPGPAQEVIAELLNGSRFNYVLLGSPEKAGVLTRVVLVAKTTTPAENASANNQQPAQAQPVMNQLANVTPQEATDTTDPDPPEEAADDTADQPEAPEGDQQAQQGDQPEVKTPQQMLQEMQQRQMQLQQQQQQNPGAPPAPGSVLPQRAPQDQQPQPQ